MLLLSLAGPRRACAGPPFACQPASYPKRVTGVYNIGGGPHLSIDHRRGDVPVTAEPKIVYGGIQHEQAG